MRAGVRAPRSNPSWGEARAAGLRGTLATRLGAAAACARLLAVAERVAACAPDRWGAFAGVRGAPIPLADRLVEVLERYDLLPIEDDEGRMDRWEMEESACVGEPPWVYRIPLDPARAMCWYDDASAGEALVYLLCNRGGEDDLAEPYQTAAWRVAAFAETLPLGDDGDAMHAVYDYAEALWRGEAPSGHPDQAIAEDWYGIFARLGSPYDLVPDAVRWMNGWLDNEWLRLAGVPHRGTVTIYDDLPWNPTLIERLMTSWREARDVQDNIRRMWEEIDDPDAVGTLARALRATLVRLTTG